MATVKREICLLVPTLQNKVKLVVDTLAFHNIPIKLFETLRTKERQKQIFDKGYSKTMKSLHLKGEAADFVVKIDGKWSWDYEKYSLYYHMFGIIATHYGLTWGGNWKSFKDYPHVQIK